LEAAIKDTASRAIRAREKSLSRANKDAPLQPLEGRWQEPTGWDASRKNHNEDVPETFPWTGWPLAMVWSHGIVDPEVNRPEAWGTPTGPEGPPPEV